MYGSGKKSFTTTNDIFDAFVQSLYSEYENCPASERHTLFTEDNIIAMYIRGLNLDLGKPWAEVDEVIMPMNVRGEHWLLLRLILGRRQILIYDSIRNEGHDGDILRRVKAYAVILPIFCDICNVFKSKDGKGKEKLAENRKNFEVLHCPDLPQQGPRECGAYVLAFAEFIAANKRKIPLDFDIEAYRNRLSCLLFHYGKMKMEEGYHSDVDVYQVDSD